MEEQIIAPAKLKDLTSRCMDRGYDTIYNLATSLPNNAPEERRDTALRQLQDLYTIFKKVLIVTRWSVQSPLADKCAELLQEAKSFQDQTNETNDRLFFLHADLDRTKERMYDISTAIDVLYEGTYKRLPRIIQYAMHPRELPPVDEEKWIDEINDIIRFRLIEEDIPDKFSQIDVRDGFVIADAGGEFGMVFTVDGKNQDSIWLIVSVNTVLTNVDAQAQYKHLASTSSLRIIQNNAPTDVHYMQLKILIQKRLNTSKTPLVDACDIMRDFCCSLALKIMFAQGQLLTETRWIQQVEFIPHGDEALDIVYWKETTTSFVQTDGFSAEEMRRRLKQTALEFPKAGLCIRLFADTKHRSLFSVQLFPAPPSELCKLFPELFESLVVPRNMYGISAEHFLLGAMQVHAACALHSLAKHLLVHGSKNSKLHTGEDVIVTTTANSLNLSRVECSSQNPIEISVDMRSGQFVVFSLASAESLPVQRAVRHFESMLQAHCKVQLPGITIAGEYTLKFGDVNAVLTGLSLALREITALELSNFASSCTQLEVHHVGEQYHSAVEKIGLSPSALYLELIRCRDSSVYLVVELDIDAELKLGARDSDEWIRSPSFSILHLTKSTCNVKTFERIPAIRCDDIICAPNYSGKKRKRDSHTISSLLLHAVGICYQRIQWHYFDGYARKHNLDAITKDYMVTIPWNDRGNGLPIHSIQGKCKRSRGMEIIIHFSTLPFQYIQVDDVLSSKKLHCILKNGDLLYRIPSHLKYQPENPIEYIMNHISIHVRPMIDFGIKLQHTLGLLGRYQCMNIPGHYYVERADPFGFVLACHISCPINEKKILTYRIQIDHKATHQYPRGSFLLTSKGFSHILLPFIQDAFIIHKKTSLLLEVLERTTIPLGILSCIVESEMASMNKYENKKFNLNQPYPENTFIPSNLLLIPISQTHLRLVYADRCGIDLFFLAEKNILIQNAPYLLRLPSCDVPGGIKISHESFGNMLKYKLFVELASL